MSSNVESFVENNVGYIYLDRQKSRNALTFEMLRSIELTVREWSVQPEVRCIVFSGKGKAYCAGDDLIDMGTSKYPVPEDKFVEYLSGYPEACKAFRECPKPIICSVHGYALGAGLELALSCDLLIAEKGCGIGLPFVLRGFSSGTHLLARLTNRMFASRLLFTGDIVPVENLEAFGLVHSLTEADERESKTKNLAEKIAQLPTKTIGLMKKAMDASDFLDERSAWVVQAQSTVTGTLTEDYAEGRRAFAEKRDPVFTGK
ncbi:enoyl-CoA hydratase/isomerase family protein [Corynebacterium camporealensis]